MCEGCCGNSKGNITSDSKFWLVLAALLIIDSGTNIWVVNKIDTDEIKAYLEVKQQESK